MSTVTITPMRDAVDPARPPLVFPGVNALSMSWEISNAGYATFVLPMADLEKTWLKVDELNALWVRIKHPTAGIWGGHVTSVVGTDGLITFNCESWASLYRGIIYGSTALPSSSISQFITNMITFAATKGGPALDLVSVASNYILGSATTFSGDVYETLLPSIVQSIDEQTKSGLWNLNPPGWVVDPVTRLIRVSDRLGTLKTFTLSDKLHHVSSTWTDDLEDLRNVVKLTAMWNRVYQEWVEVPFDRYCSGGWSRFTPAVPPHKAIKYTTGPKKGQIKIPARKGSPARQPYCYSWTEAGVRGELRDAVVQEPYTFLAEDLPSISKYGERGIEITENTVYTGTWAVEQRARDLLNYSYLINLGLVTLEVADLPANGVSGLSLWSQYREGDLVPFELTNSGMKGTMVVRVRALDEARGVMTVSGEAELRRR